MRLRETTLEDGEKVTLLRGKRALRGAPPPRWKSDLAHSGRWSPTTSYVLVPHRRPQQLVKLLRAGGEHLEDRSGDDAVLVIARHEVVSNWLKRGPSAVRARTKRGPSDPSAIAAFRFKPQTG